MINCIKSALNILNEKSKKWLSKANNENEFSKLIVYAAIAFSAILIVGLTLIAIDIYINKDLLPNSPDISNLIGKAGTFGDFLGGTLNPILSFLTFMGLLITILLQSKELEESRRELSHSAKAQEQTENTLKIQTKNLEKQKFESTFFALLNQHNELLKELNESNSLRTDQKSTIKVLEAALFKKEHESLSDAKIELEKFNDECGHYFRVLYQILKYIALECPESNVRPDKLYINADLVSAVSESEKFYSNIVRSFLGYTTTQILAVNCYCTSEKGTYYTYKLLTERFELLEHMPFRNGNKVLEECKTFYSDRAFGNSTFK